MIGLSTGEEKRNAIVGPKGTPPLSSPDVIGTVEHETKLGERAHARTQKYCIQVNLLDRKSRTRDGGRVFHQQTNDKETQ